jgi:hypothetical protein
VTRPDKKKKEMTLFLLFFFSFALCVDLYDHSKSVVSVAEARRYRDMMLNSSRDLYLYHNATLLVYKNQFDALVTPEERKAFPSYRLWLEKPPQSIYYQTHRKMAKGVNDMASELGQKDAVAASKANRTAIEAELVYARERVTTLAALLKSGLVTEFNKDHAGMGISIDSSDMKSSFGAGYEICRQTDAEYVEALGNILKTKNDPATEPIDGASGAKNNRPSSSSANGKNDLGGPQPPSPLSTTAIIGFVGLFFVAGAAGFAWHRHRTRFSATSMPIAYSKGSAATSDPSGGSELLAIINDDDEQHI